MKLILSTSREPSRRTRSFVKDLTLVIKDLIRVNRGKKTLKDLLNIMRSYGSRGVLLVLERRGNPSALSYYVERDGDLRRVLLIKLASVKLIREIRGAQKPFTPCRPIIDEGSVEGEVPADIVNAVKTVLNLSGDADDNLDEVVRLKFRRLGDYITLTFECLGSGRVCGPELRISKVKGDAA